MQIGDSQRFSRKGHNFQCRYKQILNRMHTVGQQTEFLKIGSCILLKRSITQLNYRSRIGSRQSSCCTYWKKKKWKIARANTPDTIPSNFTDELYEPAKTDSFVRSSRFLESLYRCWQRTVLTCFDSDSSYSLCNLLIKPCEMQRYIIMIDIRLNMTSHSLSLWNFWIRALKYSKEG